MWQSLQIVAVASLLLAVTVRWDSTTQALDLNAPLLFTLTLVLSVAAAVLYWVLYPRLQITSDTQPRISRIKPSYREQFYTSLVSSSHSDSQLLLAQLKHTALQLQAMSEDNTALRQALITEQERARNHLGQTLHDDLGQYVVAMRTQIKLLHMVADQPQQVRNIARLLEEHANHVQHGFRCVVEDLYPVSLQQLTVTQLLHKVQAHWQQLHGGRCTLYILNAPPQLSLVHKQQLQRLLQEVLTNAQRHGRATHVQLWLQYKQQVWRLLVRDNGCGGELGIYGAGLHSIRARAQALDAQLFIKARPTRGWTLYLRAPLVSGTNENTLG